MPLKVDVVTSILGLERPRTSQATMSVLLLGVQLVKELIPAEYIGSSDDGSVQIKNDESRSQMTEKFVLCIMYIWEMQNATAACNEVEKGFSNKGTVLENRWTATVVLYGSDDGADSMYNNLIYCREDLVEPESSP
jgi:hypothetical protein